MSLSCVEELLRTVSDRLTEFLVRVDRFEKEFRFEGEVGGVIFTLALLNYLLNRCKTFRAPELREVYFNCDGRYLYIQTGFWSQFETKIQRNRLANGLFEQYSQAISKLPKEDWITSEEEELLKHLSKFDTFIIVSPSLSSIKLLYNIIAIVYKAPPMRASIDGYILNDPAIAIKPSNISPEKNEITFQANITSHQAREEILYQVFFYSSTRKIKENVRHNNEEEYVKIGRKGACLVKDKLLDEFDRLISLLDGTFSFALIYLLY
jgi:hypothetical protein